jgi:hypothetical protein
LLPHLKSNPLPAECEGPSYEEKDE